MIPAALVSYLTADFPYANEAKAFGMAFQGCMAVRNGRNRDKKLAWFHAFMISLLTAFAGGIFTNIWVGKPSLLLSSDINMACCIVAFLIVNCTPWDIGYKLGNTFPIVILTTLLGQLFRVTGMMGFTTVGFEMFKDRPSDYYPAPVFGPILFATLLANMGGFFNKGVDGYLKNGMPWPVQNGLFAASFYHFFVNDQSGFIGVNLRKFIDLAPGIKMGFDEKTFAKVAASLFMHICGLLRLPFALGPSFNPFNSVYTKVENLMPNVYEDSTSEIELKKMEQKKEL